MPSKSKAQQRFMGMVHAVKKGELSPSKVSDKVKKAASSMSKKDAKDFASTKHKGKPEKVKQETRVRSLIKKMVREVLDEIELEEGFLTGKKGEKQSTKNRSEVFDYKMVGDNDNPTFDLSTDTGRGDGNFPSGNLSSLKEGKRRQLKIPVMDKLKTNKILKKLKMKIGKDYDIGVGKGSTFVLDVDQKVLNKILDPLISNRIRVKEGKLKEDYKNSKWEVYVGDDAYGKNRKVVKVAKSKRAATILYNKLIKTDKYFEVGMRAVKEGKLTEKKMDRKKAAIILKQIGGNRFIAMTGAKGFAFSDKYMSFKIGRNSKGINFVRIAHNAMDTYDMEFGFVSVRGIKVKKKVKGVYADMLGTMFKKYTGMNVSL